MILEYLINVNGFAEGFESSGDNIVSWPSEWGEEPTSSELEDIRQNAELFNKWSAVRLDRNRLISSCDWTQFSDSPLSEEEKSSWASYRQALRDITDDFATPDEITWPESP